MGWPFPSHYQNHQSPDRMGLVRKALESEVWWDLESPMLETQSQSTPQSHEERERNIIGLERVTHVPRKKLEEHLQEVRLRKSSLSHWSLSGQTSEIDF